MATPSLELKLKDPRGSKLRCLTLTGMLRLEIAQALTRMVAPHASVDENDVWLPRGPESRTEAQLGRTAGFVSDVNKKVPIDWWLAVKRSATTPNWDIASTCTIEDRQGLLLVEAKAHKSELHLGGKPKGNELNAAQIASAIGEANHCLNDLTPSPGN